MKIASEFIKLPFQFDVERLQYELSQFVQSDWCPHPNKIKGNDALPLISENGTANDSMSGEMMMTECLKKSPYLQQLMAEFGEVFGRSRLMSLKASCTVPLHNDAHYHWFDRVRIHIPIITNPQVIFYCQNESVHMKAGEAWIFDAWKMHRVVNNSNETRIHLVLDTCGSSKFWEMVANSEFFPNKNKVVNKPMELKYVPFLEEKKVEVLTEKFNVVEVMSPGEVNYLLQDLINDAMKCSINDPVLLEEFVMRVDAFRKDWRKIWSLYGTTEESKIHFQKIIQKASVSEDEIKLSDDGVSAQMTFSARVLSVALRSIGAIKASPVKIDKPKPKTINSVGFGESVIPISRNSPCSCGSNKKYKHCCG